MQNNFAVIGKIKVHAHDRLRQECHKACAHEDSPSLNYVYETSENGWNSGYPLLLYNRKTPFFGLFRYDSVTHAAVYAYRVLSMVLPDVVLSHPHLYNKPKIGHLDTMANMVGL
jgi:hypothetical protein